MSAIWIVGMFILSAGSGAESGEVVAPPLIWDAHPHAAHADDIHDMLVVVLDLHRREDQRAFGVNILGGAHVGDQAHDDHFLVIEVAQSWTDGSDYNNWLPGSGNTQPSGHSFFYCGLHYLFFSVLQFLGVVNPEVKMFLVRLVHALLSLLPKEAHYFFCQAKIPRALDANEFILDNLAGRAGVNVFNGALYFWDHFGLSNNHNLAEYEGGYATYTLIGGVKAINNSSLTLNNGVEGGKIPGRYIPVGQGFFVDAYLDPTLSGTEATVSGGNIKFKNSQRAFVRESTPNSVFMKKRGATKPNPNVDTRQKIRLGFISAIGAHRQLLVGVDVNATPLFDLGFDAPMFDTNANDMYWEVSDSQFVIQAVPDFNTNQIVPLGIVVANAGEVTIKIDELENVTSSTKIYLHDNETEIDHNIKDSDFKISLAVGEYNNRFSLRFESNKTLTVDEVDLNDEINVLYSNNYKILIISNKSLDTTVNSVSLYNILGQSVSDWKVEDKEQSKIQIPIKSISSGIYIVKLKTSKGESSKKIIVN